MLVTDKIQLKKYTTTNRIWQGIPGICKTQGGRLFCTFYSGGTKEQPGNYAVLIMSDDDGKTWTEPIACADAGENNRCYDANVWTDPLGRVWFYWSVMPNHNVWGCICENPDEKNITWSEPRIIGEGDVMLNKPTVLSTGEWIFSIAVWDKEVMNTVTSQGSEKVPGTYVFKSSNNGETFTKLGCAEIPGRCYDEHMVVECSNSHLMMLVRAQYGIAQSFSYDRGETWTKGTDSKIPGPNSRFFITKLNDGSILLVNHYEFSGRNNLAALVSDDDCKTWKGPLMLDERANVSYPDGFQDKDGYIYVTYDRERGSFCPTLEDAKKCAREILFAKFRKEDILEGKPVSEGSKLKCIINKLGEYNGECSNPYGIVSLKSDEEYTEELCSLCDGEKIVKKLFSDYGRNCQFSNDGESVILDSNISAILKYSAKGTNTDELKKTVLAAVRNIRSSPTLANESDLFADMLRFINENLFSDFTREDMSRALNVSKYYMSHLFKGKTNISLMKYIVTRRIYHAKRLLVGGDMRVSDIAAKCGFADAYYFSKVFKLYEEVSPKEYRKMHR